MTQSRPPAPPRRPPAPPGRPPGAKAAPNDATQQMRRPPASPPRPGAAQKAKPKGPQRTPGHPSMEDVINRSNEEGYSDIHLGVGEKPRVRDRGEMIVLEDYPITDEPTFWSWMQEICKEQEIQQFKDTKELDTATQYDFARVRINVFDTLTGPSIVMRLIPLKILSLEQIRAPEVFRDISDAHKGLVLVTGPTGSGKSTTMAAMIDYINKEHAKHIITIEDPIEFIHRSRRSLVKHREVGTHTLLFDNALKAALREDPDLILVGEMRDRGTVNTALKAAQTGHLVMGTLHTNSAVKTIERILNLYSAEEQHSMRIALAESLVAIIAQGLCRTTDGKRAAFHDILINTETMKEYIGKGQYEEMHELMMQSKYDGMTTMNTSLYNLYEEGRITEETALEKSPTPNEMAQMLRGRI
ncbi:MAG: type IV pilus twitching motility protein PilT [Cyanobacteria bacterium SBLK]|nr:type IV pilus twitching motility protein PilT [Cyanobacteria bacterium SBLK]